MEIKMIRKIDKLGRIVIPKDIRSTLNFDAGKYIQITVGQDCCKITAYPTEDWHKRPHGCENK